MKNLTNEARETITNMIYYYDRLSIDEMLKRRPEFVSEDMQKLLNILEEVLEV